MNEPLTIVEAKKLVEKRFHVDLGAKIKHAYRLTGVCLETDDKQIYYVFRANEPVGENVKVDDGVQILTTSKLKGLRASNEYLQEEIRHIRLARRLKELESEEAAIDMIKKKGIFKGHWPPTEEEVREKLNSMTDQEVIDASRTEPQSATEEQKVE